MLFYYIRHGDPIYNPDSLTPFGHEQAEALSKRFVKLGFDRIYTSDSMRAQMTAAPTAQKLGLTPTVVPWANESRPYERMCAFFENGNRDYIFDHPVTKAQFVSKEVRDLADDWATHDAFKNETSAAIWKRSLSRSATATTASASDLRRSTRPRSAWHSSHTKRLDWRFSAV